MVTGCLAAVLNCLFVSVVPSSIEMLSSLLIYTCSLHIEVSKSLLVVCALDILPVCHLTLHIF